MQDAIDNIQATLEWADGAVKRYKNLIKLADNNLENLNLSCEHRQKLIALKNKAYRKMDELRLAQLIMLEEQKMKEIIVSN